MERKRSVALVRAVLVIGASTFLVSASDIGFWALTGHGWVLGDRLQLVGLFVSVLVYALTDGGASLALTWPIDRRAAVLALGWLGAVAIGTSLGVGAVEYSDAIDVAAFAVTGVLAEELMFRGAVYSTVLAVLPTERELPWSTIVITSVVFMLGHLQYYQFDLGTTLDQRGYVVLNGLVYGVLRARSRSIWPCVAVHAAGNLIAIATGGHL